MKTLAFAFAVCISAVGVVGFLVPSFLVRIAEQFDRAGAFYLIAAVRIAFGVVLISAASASRLPRTLRGLGSALVFFGILSAFAGLLALGQARSAIEWWTGLGSGIVRLTAVPVIAVGSFIAYACAPGHGIP